MDRFKPVGHPHGPSQFLTCATCGTTFEHNMLTEVNCKRITIRTAHGKQKYLAPKCPVCNSCEESVD